MFAFVIVLIVAFVVGGLVGGELVGGTFSFLSATVGCVGTAVVLLGLGAYFHAQERKRSGELTPETRSVFDRMVTGKENPSLEEVERAKRALRNRRGK